MFRTFSTCLGLLALCGTVRAAEATKTVFKNNEEILYLDGLGSASRWAPSEATVTDAKTKRAMGRPTLHFHIKVDYHSGQKHYLIGWPRMYANLIRGVETRWSEYDCFEFEVYAEMTRKAPPSRPLNFQMHCPDKRQATYRNLSEIRLGKWVTISIPTAEIPHVEQIARLGFNIAEADYHDLDVLDFYIGAFRLVRSATCEVTSMTIRAPAIFTDRGTVPVELVVAGPPKNVSRGVPMTLCRGDRVLRVETLPVERGKQTVQVDVSELRLTPGVYRLILFAKDPKRRVSGTFRVVESPWKE